MEESWLLGYKREMFAVVENVDLGDVLAIAQDAAFVEIIEPVAHKKSLVPINKHCCSGVSA